MAKKLLKSLKPLKNLKPQNLLGKSVCVTWLDAAGNMKEDRENLEGIPPTSLLVETKTYGTFFSEDEGAILILQEESELSVDYTVIPKSFVVSIESLVTRNRK